MDLPAANGAQSPLAHRLQQLASKSSTALLVLDESGRIVEANDAAAALVNAERGAIIGKVVSGQETDDHEGTGRRRPPAARPLTTREREILQMLAFGSTGEQIAEQLALSPETVQKHVHNAKRKIGAETRAHMIALSIKHGLIDPL